MSNPDISWTSLYNNQADADGYVAFNADRRLGQNQSASRYADGAHDSPNLGSDLRWKNLDSGNYHDLLIHKDDLVTFHARVKAYQHDASYGRAKDAQHYLAITGKS